MPMTDIFRPQYRELSDREKGQIDAIKTKAGELYDLISYWMTEPKFMLPPNRELSLAKTKLEESIMWAVKDLTGPVPGNTAATSPLGGMQIGVAPTGANAAGNPTAPANQTNSAS